MQGVTTSLQDKTLERIAQRYAPYLIARGLGDIDDARQEVLIAWEQCKDCEELSHAYRRTRDFVYRTLGKYYGSRRKYQGFEGTFQRVVQESGDERYEIVGEEDDRTNSDVDELLAKLPDKYREIYRRRLRRESGKEIADALGLTEGAVSYRLYVARLIMADYETLYRKLQRKKRARYYAANREACLAYGRKYYAENREQRLKYLRDYYAAHREERLQEYSKLYAEKRDEIRKRASKYYFANKEKVRARQRKYVDENRDKVSESRRRYYEAHREKLLEKGRRYREANREKLREKDRRYGETHREELRERQRCYREKHREELREKARRYREAHREEIREKDRRYREKHREKLREKRRLRYAREKENKNANDEERA